MSFSRILQAFALLVPLAAAQACVVESLPNPLAGQTGYPDTGTVNGTASRILERQQFMCLTYESPQVAILPIPYKLARSIIPSQYPILKKQYQQWLPWLPKDQYPAMLQTELDHDLGGAGGPGGSFPDFSRSGISFPFVDRLNDGYSAFAYNDHILLSAIPGLAAGFTVYGYIVTNATFEPSCNAYAYAPGGKNGAVYRKAFPENSTTPGIEWEFTPVSQSPISLNFWNNVTNQPFMSNDPTSCDNFNRLLNTKLSQPPYAPQPVKGKVSATKPYFAETTTWSNAWGVLLDQPFLESGPVPCDSLKGFSVAVADEGSYGGSRYGH